MGLAVAFGLTWAVISLVAPLFASATKTAHERSAELAAQGRAVLGVGDAFRAVELLEEAVRLDPRNPFTQISLGDAYLFARRESDAKAAFQATVDLDPSGPYGERARSGLQLLEKIETDRVRRLRRL